MPNIFEISHKLPKFLKNAQDFPELLENSRKCKKKKIENNFQKYPDKCKFQEFSKLFPNSGSVQTSTHLDIFSIPDIKQDLTIIYAFCRVTDDMIDTPESTDLKKERLDIIVKFLNQLFRHRHVKNYFEWTEDIEDSAQKIDWPYFENCLSDEELSAFRSVTLIAYYLPHEPFYELVEGYKWDIDEKPVRNELDLMEYSKYVASSVATLCTFIFCYKSNQWPDNFGPACQCMIENARKMGMVTQIQHFIFNNFIWFTVQVSFHCRFCKL